MATTDQATVIRTSDLDSVSRLVQVAVCLVSGIHSGIQGTDTQAAVIATRLTDGDHPESATYALSGTPDIPSGMFGFFYCLRDAWSVPARSIKTVLSFPSNSAPSSIGFSASTSNL